MGKNEIVTNNGSKISVKGAEALRDEVTQGLKVLTKGFIAIMPQIAKLYDTKGFKALGYQNIDDMCKSEWNMSHGTVVGIRKVWSLIGTVSVNNEYTVPEKYQEWGYTALLTIANDKAKFEEAGIKPFETFTPDMSIKDMKQALALALGDKAKEQDENAIDTEATEATEATPLEKLDIIIEYSKELRKLVEMNNWLKPEKYGIFEAITNYAKEAKKELKKSNK